MHITLSIIFDKICLILAICPNFKIKKMIKDYLFNKAVKNGSLDYIFKKYNDIYVSY
jgi:hypothetical protein